MSQDQNEDYQRLATFSKQFSPFASFKKKLDPLKSTPPRGSNFVTVGQQDGEEPYDDNAIGRDVLS